MFNIIRAQTFLQGINTIPRISSSSQVQKISSFIQGRWMSALSDKGNDAKLQKDGPGTDIKVQEGALRAGTKYKHLLIERDEGLFKIILNRPNKKNAVLVEMYKEWIAALDEAQEDPKAVVVAITGAGDYFCAGNDLSNILNANPDKLEEEATNFCRLIQRFVAAFIDFPKTLVGVINGPAVGIGVTFLGHYDAVYSSDKATFHCPFISLGQSPEGCSSYTFPRILGPGLATEMLLFGKKVPARDLCEAGLVTEVFPDHSFQSEVWPRLRELSKLPINALMYTKQLSRGHEIEILHKVNEAECNRLIERALSEDFKTAVAAFFNRKNK